MPVAGQARANSKSQQRYIHHDPDLDLWCCEIRRTGRHGKKHRWRRRAKDLESVVAFRDRVLKEIEKLENKGLV